MFEELEKKSLSEIAKEAGYFTRENISKKELASFFDALIGLLRKIRVDFDEDYFIEEFAIYDHRIFYVEMEG
jgi:hypothetical protein